jgi:hypothetical protein
MRNGRIREGEGYRAALREAVGSVPLDTVDWDALYARVDAAAAVPLARRRSAAAVRVPRRRDVAWWEYAARPGRAAIPLAVAASLALCAYIGFHPVDTSSVAEASAAAGVSSGDVRDAFEATVTGATSSRQVATLLVASPSDAAPVADDDAQ